MRKKMAKLKTGDPAPAFEAVDQDGNMKTLADYRGRKLILYFYPKDNTIRRVVRPKPAVCATGGIRCGEWVSKWSA